MTVGIYLSIPSFNFFVAIQNKPFVSYVLGGQSVTGFRCVKRLSWAGNRHLAQIFTTLLPPLAQNALIFHKI
ncbi:hypothetical protein DCMF_06990 [Candidatus Formimonas warabiya]|uniref:Uncharacterized protein n=1 Tax=Formimonas warabiya TaxID=1761012 RepID=A0A3G1KQ08_FORW1|nr:hypothetical protein DCMF_06990 [Candidatus Formimonas warabiya]